ncbi:MAG: carboxyl transferase domain-containing protein, partial [Dehalococcoidales bacterium]|nr:carboxyl transferase domain-containing protein [Dehalococcoidales bacterium]
MGFQEAVNELYRRREKAKQMGGAEKLQKQHARGRLTARERIEQFLDPGSFWEMGLLNTSHTPGQEDVSAANGRIIGMGAVDGRRVAIEAQDNTVLGGSGDLYAHHKVAQLERMANERGYPIVRLMDGIGGARLPEQMGSRGMVHDK